jgi:superfamily II DNA/RNA helicase
LIAALPNFYLQMRQFIGRTARIGNKGSYTIVVLDKSQKNSEAEVFFKKKIEELKNNDVIGLSKIEV